MIHLCTCTASFSFDLVNNFKQIEASKICMSCGGKLSLDGRGVLSSDMSTFGLDLSSVIDPQLNWKTCSKGRQRAVRRARTSLTWGSKKPASGTLQESDSLRDNNPQKTSNMSVPEFEKLGVSILGQRFSDNLGSVPIKKRRFLFVRSPSPPHQSSSDSDTDQERRSAGYEEAANTKHLTGDADIVTGIELGEESIHDGKPDLLRGTATDSADFSGISILAAAACGTNIGGHVLNAAETSTDLKAEEEEGQTHIKEVFVGITETPSETLTNLGMPSEESVVVKVDGSCSEDTSVRSLVNVADKIPTVESSSRDTRFHWDLNTVMDAWESPSSDNTSSEPPEKINFPAENIGNVQPQSEIADTMCALKHNSLLDSGGGAIENVGNAEPQIELADFMCASKLSNIIDSGDDALKERQMQEMTDFCDNTPRADHDQGPIREDHKMEVAAVPMMDDSEEANKLHDQDNLILITAVPSPIRGSPLSTCYSAAATAAVLGGNGDTCCAAHDSVAQTEGVNTAIGTAMTSAVLDEHMVHYNPGGIHTLQATMVRCAQAENHAPFRENLGNLITDQNSVANLPDEKTSSVMVHGDICKSVENIHANAIKESPCGSAGSTCPLTLESLVLHSQGLCSYDELAGASSAGKFEKLDVDSAMQDSKCSVQPEKTFKPTISDTYAHTDSDFAVSNSVTMKPLIVAVPSVEVALQSNGIHKSQTGSCDASTSQVSLGDNLDCDYYSDASQHDTDQLTRMEKVGFLRDEDYQYEDGEFRESSVNRWREDGPDDDETEHVDYDSDNRETDVFEDVFEINDSDVVGTKCKNGTPDANCHMKYGEQARMELQGSDSLLLMQCLSHEGSVKKTDNGSRELEMDTEVLVSDVGTEVRDEETLNAGVAKSSNLSKPSGWDQLPEGCRSFESGGVVSGVDPGGRNTDALLGTPEGSSPRRNILSQAARLQSSDASCRKDKLYSGTSRPNDQNDTHPPRISGRCGSSLHTRGQEKRQRWVDSGNYCGPDHHDARGCYGMANPRHLTSKNAAAAAVAKLESNGFVVAADGTIIKAAGVRSTGQVLRRRRNELPHSVSHSVMGRRSSGFRDEALGIDNSREMSLHGHISINRDRVTSGRYGGHEMAGTSDRERYHRCVIDDSRDASFPLHLQLSRREKSISPLRRPLNRSDTRSPLRSRTRSPRLHTPTPSRGRNERGMNASPDLRVRSRSPHFISQVRPQGQRSYYQSDLRDNMADYSPSSRNPNSPPRASRWVDQRKGSTDQFREHDPNQFSERNRPSRSFSQDKRHHQMNSLGRERPNEYHRPSHSGTFPEFGNFYRGCNGPDDERRGGNGNRYEMLHSGRRYDTAGNTKQVRYDAENVFRGRNARPGSLEFQRRGSPRGFAKSTGTQVGESPRRLKEDKINDRHDRDEKHKAGF